ncbi:MAG: ABC transporter ATP-binding protein [Methanobacteriaceae archaeon]|nr:ABC transporter ATP-binding protein [Methanobacteriaceae archaeon]
MAIKVNHISKSFKQEDKDILQVLDDINLDIKDREFICLLGPSGCGKTTLLRIIAGLDKPDIGEVHDGTGLVTGPSKERGFIFQQYSLFPWMTVLDNVQFGLNMSHPDQKEKNAEDAKRYLQRVGLENFQNSYPHQLSGGMKQRVAIIRSLLNHTPVQLMDEPFSAVDMQTRHILQEQLIGVWKRFDTTIVFVTHDVDEAVFLADKVVVMDKNPGHVKDIVSIDLERPRKRESAEFIKIQEEVMDALGVEDMEG